jgi:cell wall-associated NlpC family hydrolase
MTSVPDGIVSRREVLQRAQFWVTQKVHYFSADGRFPAAAPDPAGRPYRTDCSGFVCMAWHAASEPSTAEFDSIGYPIDRQDLLPGDALLWKGLGGYGLEGGHVLLFAGWTGDRQDSYLGYELSGGQPARHEAIPFPYRRGDLRYQPWRYRKVASGD